MTQGIPCSLSLVETIAPEVLPTLMRASKDGGGAWMSASSMSHETVVPMLASETSPKKYYY
eukprot:scaffold32322_cov36-Tisochrysis_lutea.AAC.1